MGTFQSRNSGIALGHTLHHIDCPECDRVRALMLCSFSADLGFREAGKMWLDARSIDALPGSSRAHYIRANTHDSYGHYIDSLALFFGDIPLNKIHVGHFKEYQRLRIAGAEPFVRFRRPQDAKPKELPDGTVLPPKGKTPCPAQPKKVNQELCILRKLLMRAGAWTAQMEELYEPLLEDEDQSIPRAQTPAEQKRWLDTANSRPEWHVVLWYSLLAFGTCVSTDEERAIRLGDINLFQRVLVIPRGKCKQRSRTIELVGSNTLWAIEKLMERARDMGSKESHHVLFPWRVHRDEFDPTKPMSESGIKKPWEEVRAAADLKWFRQYDCRHTAITRLAESGTPTDIIMSRAGHVSEKMRQHYTHISRSAQRRWMEEALEREGMWESGRFQPQRENVTAFPATYRG